MDYLLLWNNSRKYISVRIAVELYQSMIGNAASVSINYSKDKISVSKYWGIRERYIANRGCKEEKRNEHEYQNCRKIRYGNPFPA